MKDAAYLVLAHTDPVHLGRLCRALDYRSRIFVHLDAKTDIQPFLAQDLPDSVHFIEDRVRVSWAAYSQVEATLHLIRAALSFDQEFSHLVMLSGLDYPIKPVEQLLELFNRNPKQQFIRFVDASETHYRVYFDHYWFLEANSAIPPKLDRAIRHGFGRAIRPFLRKPRPSGIQNIFWGSAYWALTPQCAQYILNFASEHPDYVRWARSSFAVDEHFFHTIVGNSPFCTDSDGIFPYQGSKTYLMASLHEVHESMRRVHDESDYQTLRDSDKYFVRKNDVRPSDKLIKLLDQNVLFPDKPEVVFATRL